MHFFKFANAAHLRSLDRHREERLSLIREKLHADDDAGPNEFGRQAVKMAFNTPAPWLQPSQTPGITT